MGRIRTIKPTYFTDEDLSTVSAESALLGIGLLCYADDAGYFNANPKLIDAAIFPLRQHAQSIQEMLSELQGVGYIQLGVGADKKHYGRVTTFSEHQRVNRPAPSKIATIAITWHGTDASKEKVTKQVNDDSVSTHTQFTEGSVNCDGNISDVTLSDHAPLSDESLSTQTTVREDSLTEGNKEGKGKEVVPNGTCRPDVRPEEFAETWNRLRGPLPKVREFTDSRRRKVKVRINQGVTLEKFEDVIHKCVQTPFLVGNNPHGWQVSFDWLIENDTHIPAVLEGKYDSNAPLPIRDVPRPPTQEERAEETRQELIKERRDYEMWKGMNAEFKKHNPWCGKQFDDEPRLEHMEAVA